MHVTSTIPFLSKLFILCSLAYKRYGFVIVNTKTIQKQRKCENLNNKCSIYSDNSVGYWLVN